MKSIFPSRPARLSSKLTCTVMDVELEPGLNDAAYTSDPATPTSGQQYIYLTLHTPCAVFTPLSSPLHFSSPRVATLLDLSWSTLSATPSEPEPRSYDQGLCGRQCSRRRWILHWRRLHRRRRRERTLGEFPFTRLSKGLSMVVPVCLLAEEAPFAVGTTSIEMGKPVYT